MVAGSSAPSHDDAHHDRPPRWSVGRVLLLAATGVCLYLFAPSIAEVFEASDKLGEVHPLAIPAILLLESASFLCVWILQRIALRTHGWFPIVTTQLAGNFFNRITPGGGATGTALQARMLVDAGFNAAKAGTAITVQSLLITAAVLVLPVLALPAIIAGTSVPGSLADAAWIGILVFGLLAGIIALLLARQSAAARRRARDPVDGEQDPRPAPADHRAPGPTASASATRSGTRSASGGCKPSARPSAAGSSSTWCCS